MSVESATYLHQLDATNPKGTDQRSTADDHARLIKKTLKNTFPNLSSEVSASAGEMNAVKGLTTSVAATIADLSATLGAHIDTRVGSLSAAMEARVNAVSSAYGAMPSCLVADEAVTFITATTTVVFSYTAHDFGGIHDTADGALVVPAGAKKVRLVANFQHDARNSGFDYLVWMTKNGSADEPGLPVAAGGYTDQTLTYKSMVSGVISCTAGDRFHLIGASGNRISVSNPRPTFSMEVIDKQ
jgi:hypothetical protein